MNIAFTALLVLFLALPGIILCYAYRSEYGRPAGSGPLTDEIPVGLAISAALHAIWLAVAYGLGSLLPQQIYPDLHAALVLLGGQPGKDGKLFDQAVRSVTDYPLHVLFYFGTIFIAAGLIGRYAKQYVAYSGLDKRLPILKWNDWFYLLNGESADGTEPEVEYAGWRITAVVGEYVYWGVLYDYVVGKSGDLDSVIVMAPMRRKIGDGEKPEDDLRDEARPGTHRINAQFLVLKYAECTNLALLGIEVGGRSVPPTDHSHLIAQTARIAIFVANMLFACWWAITQARPHAILIICLLSLNLAAVLCMFHASLRQLRRPAE